MPNDSDRILTYLVHTDLWSTQSRLSLYNHIVVDVESIVTSLFRLCVSNHISRVRSATGANQPSDLYSATLINYKEYSRCVTQLLDFFQDHHLEPVLVYEGKFMEAPIYGLLAAEFTRNTEQVRERVTVLSGLDKQASHLDPVKHLSRPNLSLNIFKSIVNARRQSGAAIKLYQAFYSALPLMAKLARDYRCPVLTNNCEFILMDVRAGFMLFDDFWKQHVDLHTLVTKDRSRSRSKDSDSKKPRSRIKSAPRSADTHAQLTCKFHLNSLFLRQHPGLTASTALHLFPLTSMDLVTKYPKSLKRLQIYEKEYVEKDFVSRDSSTGSKKQAYLAHHMAANRFEMAMKFLTSKTLDIVGNLIRSEAERTKTSLDDDYRELLNYYSAAYGFGQRLRFTLKYVVHPLQLHYIERCLLERECTAEWLLVLLCCSIGKMASVGYNRHIQFEDLASKYSTLSIQNELKSMFMSLFSENKSHKSEHSVSLSKRQRDTVTRYSTASLTIIERKFDQLIEQTVATTCENSKLDQFRMKFQLSKLASNKMDKQDSAQFLNLAFKTTNLLKMSQKLEQLVAKHITDSPFRNELAIVVSLLQFNAQTISSRDDKYAIELHRQLFPHFECAIVNHYLYTNFMLSKSASKSGNSELADLINLVNKQDFENLCVFRPIDSKAESQKSSSSSRESIKKRKKSPSASWSKSLDGTSKQVRHMIELLTRSLEAYHELNAFFEHPLPKLNLHKHYNPILLFNLTLHSLRHPKNKAMLRYISL